MNGFFKLCRTQSPLFLESSYVGTSWQRGLWNVLHGGPDWGHE